MQVFLWLGMNMQGSRLSLPDSVTYRRDEGYDLIGYRRVASVTISQDQPLEASTLPAFLSCR